MPENEIPLMVDWVVTSKSTPATPERVRAAYYKPSSGQFEFKDDRHKTVFSIAQDDVLKIRRVAAADDAPREVTR